MVGGGFLNDAMCLLYDRFTKDRSFLIEAKHFPNFHAVVLASKFVIIWNEHYIFSTVKSNVRHRISVLHFCSKILLFSNCIKV